MNDYVSPFDMNPGNGWDGHKEWLKYREMFARGEDADWAFDSMLFRVSEDIPHMAPAEEKSAPHYMRGFSFTCFMLAVLLSGFAVVCAIGWG